MHADEICRALKATHKRADKEGRKKMHVISGKYLGLKRFMSFHKKYLLWSEVPLLEAEKGSLIFLS